MDFRTYLFKMIRHFRMFKTKANTHPLASCLPKNHHHPPTVHQAIRKIEVLYRV